jgi:NitT/TauT family transport system substrate-binding protein
MKYKLLVGLVAALASSLLVSAAAKVDDPAITIAVGVDPAFTPFFVADAQGMFKKEGLNVQIQQHANAGVAADALVARTVDVAGVPDFNLLIRAPRVPLKAIGSIWRMSATM